MVPQENFQSFTARANATMLERQHQRESYDSTWFQSPNKRNAPKIGTGKQRNGKTIVRECML